MTSLPFDQPGTFYRGNLHLHSTNSDGTHAPAETIRLYRERGYDFVSLTDHFLPQGAAQTPPVVSDTRDLDDAGFVTIPGAELHGPGMGNGELWHIVANGLPVDFGWRDRAETGPELAARARAAGAYVSIAHPHWNCVSLDDAATLLPHVHAVEIYNHGCQVEVDCGESWHFADLLLQAGHRLNAIATDDAHFNYPGSPERDAFGGWVMVKAPTLEPAALLAALHAGHSYSTTGPRLHDVRIEVGHLHIACDPVAFIVVSGSGSRAQRIMPGPVEGGVVSVEPFRKDGYCRVTVVAADGTRAWTNPIWLDS